jgi:early secretory antigenic target protein ESAT-6
LTGAAGASAQAAFLRFRDAADKQVREVTDIQENINRAGVQYQSAGDGAGSLQDSMGFEDPPRLAQQYNFGDIEAALAALQAQASNIGSLLDQGGACVQKLAAIWGGAGSDAYQVTQQRWDTTAAELNAALGDLVNKLSEAAASMQNTEQGIGGMFG